MKYLTAEEFDYMTEAEIDAWEEQKLMEELDAKAASIRKNLATMPLLAIDRANQIKQYKIKKLWQKRKQTK